MHDVAPAAPSPDAQPTRRLARGALALLSTQPFTWSASLAVVIFVPRYLGDSSLGEYGIASSVAALVANVAGLGMQTFLTRRAAVDPKNASVNAWGAILISAVCSVLLSLIAMIGVSAFHIAAVSPALTAIALGQSTLFAVQTVMQAALIGLGRNGRYAVTVAGTQLFCTALGLGALMVGGDVYAYAWAGLVGALVTTVLQVRTTGLRWSREAFDRRVLHDLVIGGLPFLGWNVAMRVRGGVDVILTGVLLQPSVAGWLVAAYRIISIPVFIPVIVTTPLMPLLSRSRTDPATYRKLLAGSLETVLFLTVPISAAIFALAPLIPAALGWSESLQQAVPVMTVLAFEQPLVAVDMVLASSLIALGREGPWVRVIMGRALFNPLGNLVVIPLAQALWSNGAVGAAAVDVVTEMFLFAAALYLTPRGLLTWEAAARAVRIIGAAVLLIVVARALSPYGPIPASLGGGLVYLGAALALGVIRPQQLRAVRLALRPA